MGLLCKLAVSKMQVACIANDLLLLLLMLVAVTASVCMKG